MIRDGLLMSIDKSSPTPLYVQIEILLRKLIVDGYFEEQETAVTEKYLEQQLCVSRNTIRKAISKLVEQGLLIRRKGTGISVVRDSSRIMGETINGLSFSEAAIKRGQKPSAKLLEAKKVIPRAEVAARLGLEEGEKIFYSKRVRFLDGVPVSITDSFVPVKTAPNLKKEDFTETGKSQSLHYILERKNALQILKWIESIEAITLGRSQSKILNVKTGSPSILRKDIVYSVDGLLIAYNETIMTPDYEIKGLLFMKERL